MTETVTSFQRNNGMNRCVVKDKCLTELTIWDGHGGHDSRFQDNSMCS